MVGKILDSIPQWAKSPVFVAAVFAAVLFYSGILEPPQDCITSFVPEEKIAFIEGEIVSNPAKTSSKNYYKAKLKAKKVRQKDGFESQAEGKCTVFLPADEVETRLPNGLWTKSKSGLLIEEGANLILSVMPSDEENVFFANSVRKSPNGLWQNNLLGKLQKFRAFLRLRLRFFLLCWGESGSLVLALISGDKSYLSYEIASSFRNAGLSHILALSGLHLSLFGALAFSFGQRVFGRKAGRIFSIFVIFLFVLFAGLTPSLVRAFICVLIFSLFEFLKLKEPHSICVLSLSFLIQSAVFPQHIFEAAFLLSYASLFGILLLSPLILAIFSRFLPHFISSSISVSSSAFLATCPISIFLFGTCVPIGIIASAAVSPISEIFMKAAVFAILACIFLPLLSEPLGCIISFLYEILKKTAITFAFWGTF